MALDNSFDLFDVGCGGAKLLPFVRGQVRSYTGVDFSEDSIALAKATHAHNADEVDLRCEDIVAFCARAKGRFDVATALDFSEHINDEEFVAIFSAVRSTLKIGGVLYLHTPNLEFFIERARDAGFLLRQRPEHIAVRNSEHNVDLLIRCGFRETDVKVRTLSHYNVLSLVHPLRHVPIVGRFFEARLLIRCVKAE